MMVSRTPASPVHVGVSLPNSAGKGTVAASQSKKSWPGPKRMASNRPNTSARWSSLERPARKHRRRSPAARNPNPLLSRPFRHHRCAARRRSQLRPVAARSRRVKPHRTPNAPTARPRPSRTAARRRGHRRPIANPASAGWSVFLPRSAEVRDRRGCFSSTPLSLPISLPSLSPNPNAAATSP